uniref:Defective in cullin neddylation protein n=1 Tax=Rhizophora mucronata TaxID=61149 RepID=A0A2P2N1J1_RHIMU
MYRVSGPKDLNFFCNCGDSESQSCVSEDPLPGWKITPGLKRKSPSIQKDEMETLDTTDLLLNLKRSRRIDVGLFNWDDISPGNSTNDCMEVIKLSNPLGSTKSPCAVEGCLSKGFAGLFSTCSYLQYDREREVSYTLT